MSGGKWRVLVVDDEADLRELVRMTIEFDDRLEVVAAVGSGDDAVAVLEAAAPEAAIDLLVLDHWLGGPITGLDIAALARRHFPHAKVVLFTAVDKCDVDADDPRIDTVLAKPDLIQLPEVVTQLMAAPAPLREPSARWA